MKCLQFLFCLQKSLFWQCMAFCNLKVYLLQLVFISHRDLINICDHEKWLYVVFQIRRKKHTAFSKTEIDEKEHMIYGCPIFLLLLFFRGQESMSSGGWAGAMQRTGASLFFRFQEPRMQTILLWWLLWECQQLQDHKRMPWEMSTYVPAMKHFSSLQFSIISYCFCTSPVIKVMCLTKVTALWYSILHFIEQFALLI